MDKQEKDILSVDYDESNIPSDYKFLVKKLKSIKEIINLLEKKFLKKEL